MTDAGYKRKQEDYDTGNQPKRSCGLDEAHDAMLAGVHINALDVSG